MQYRTVTAATAVVLAALCAAPALAAADTGPQTLPAMAHKGGLSAIGLTGDQRLVEFDVNKPSKTWSVGKVSGLRGDSKLVGIDFRVQNEKPYGVGDSGGVYTLNTSNAKAVKVSQLTVALALARLGRVVGGRDGGCLRVAAGVRARGQREGQHRGECGAVRRIRMLFMIVYSVDG